MVSRRIVCRAGRSLAGAYDGSNRRRGEASAVAIDSNPSRQGALSLSPLLGSESDSMYPICLFGVAAAAKMRGDLARGREGETF